MGFMRKKIVISGNLPDDPDEWPELHKAWADLGAAVEKLVADGEYDGDLDPVVDRDGV